MCAAQCIWVRIPPSRFPENTALFQDKASGESCRQPSATDGVGGFLESTRETQQIAKP